MTSFLLEFLRSLFHHIVLGQGAFDEDGNISLDARNAQLEGYQDAQKYKAYKEQILNPQLRNQLATDLLTGLGLFLSN